MANNRREEAIKYIMSQLENGYIDLGFHDQDELKIVKEAICTLIAIDAFNSIGCTSFNDLSLTKEEKEAFIKQINTYKNV